MNASSGQRRLLPAVLASLLLLAGQAAAALHAFAHDVDALDGKVCATCAAVAQLGSACVDSHVPVAVIGKEPALPVLHATRSGSTRAIAVRQRGPPAPP